MRRRGVEQGEDSGMCGKKVEEIAGRAAGGVVAGEEERFDLAHGDFPGMSCSGQRSFYFQSQIWSPLGGLIRSIINFPRLADLAFLASKLGNMVVPLIPLEIYHIVSSAMSWTSRPKGALGCSS